MILIPYISWELCISLWTLELLEDIAFHEHDHCLMNQGIHFMNAKSARNIAYTRYASKRPSIERCTMRKGMKWKREVNSCMAIKPLICIVSVTNTLHCISFLAIEFIVYLYMHYLLSRRTKELWSQSFCRWYRQGKNPLGASYARGLCDDAIYVILCQKNMIRSIGLHD